MSLDLRICPCFMRPGDKVDTTSNRDNCNGCGLGCGVNFVFTDNTHTSFYIAAISTAGCYQCALPSNPYMAGCDGNSCLAGCKEDPTLNNDIFGCASGPEGLRLYEATYTGCDALNATGDNNCVGVPCGEWNCGGETMESVTFTRTPVTAANCGGAACDMTNPTCCLVGGTAHDQVMEGCVGSADSCANDYGGQVAMPTAPTGGVLCCK